MEPSLRTKPRGSRSHCLDSDAVTLEDEGCHEGQCSVDHECSKRDEAPSVELCGVNLSRELNAASNYCRRCSDSADKGASATGGRNCFGCRQVFLLFGKPQPKDLTNSVDLSLELQRSEPTSSVVGEAVYCVTYDEADNEAESHWETDSEDAVNINEVQWHVSAARNAVPDQLSEVSISEDLLSRIQKGQKNDSDISTVLQMLETESQKPVFNDISHWSSTAKALWSQ